jgi:Protein of unknown function (DUF3237)
MATIEVRLLFSLEMDIENRGEQIGSTPLGGRAIGYVNGRFEGPGIKGTIHACDWFLTRPDGIGEADVRGTMKTDDGALIYMRYSGVLDLRSNLAAGTSPGPRAVQVRTAVRFETGAERYHELNNVQAIGVGEVSFDTGRISYNIYAL